MAQSYCPFAVGQPRFDVTPGAGGTAGATVPVTAPRPTVLPPGPGAVAVMVTVSPSARKVRLWPSASVTGSVPPQLSSRNDPVSPPVGPETVPGGEQVPGAQRRPVDGQVRELLGRGPVHPRERRLADDGVVPPHGEPQVQSAVRVAAQVVEHRGVLLGRGHPGVGQGLQRHHPRADRGGERLAQEGAQRLVLPGLDVAGRPVVDQHDAEDVLGQVVDADPLAQGGRYARRRSRPRPRCRAGSTARTPVRPGWPAARWGVPRGCRRRRRCRPGRGSRSADAASSAAAAAGPGAGSCRRSRRGARRSRSRRSRPPRTAGAARRRRAAPAAARRRSRRSCSVTSSTIRARTARPLGRPERHEHVQAGLAQRAAGQDQVGGLRTVQVEDEIAEADADPAPPTAGAEHPVRQVLRPVQRVCRHVQWARAGLAHSNPPLIRPNRMRSVSGSMTLHVPKPTQRGR